MRFHADLHIHSKYSRATSRDLDLEHLAWWACRKGIAVVGTGDFTHPVWRAELKDKLVPAGGGLFRLLDDLETAIAEKLPPACRADVRFMLEVEISTIYKKGERTRKIHHLIYAPDFATADRISERLARIGNIASDGRPILGLDSRNLLEITLESSPDAYLVPAHIWTPWFAALGSQSGFDSIAECYRDLSDHIFAVETGLSSDPGMNWRVSFLDRYRLTSNSDAHSPGKLGREATTFDCELDYFAIQRALETGRGYVGTVEFFPEEGKYHLDGHRKCNARLTPGETLAHGGACPVCGERVTVGVLHRVETLADRGEADVVPPPSAGAVSSLVPLPEVLSELAASGPASRTVERNYDQALARLGAELSILQSVPTEDIARSGSSLLAEAIGRLRAGQVIRESGYDGEYGVIRLFEEDELKRLTSGGLLFDAPIAKRKPPRTPAPIKSQDAPQVSSPPERGRSAPKEPGEGQRASDPLPPASRSTSPFQGEVGTRGTSTTSNILAGLDDEQRRAAVVTHGPLLIIAGPGSGKTRTLTHRTAHLIAAHAVPASACLAITFTRRAATEMRGRLARLLPGADQAAIHTFHSLGLSILRELWAVRVAGEVECVAILAEVLDVSAHKAQSLLRAISRAKRTLAPSPDLADTMAAYQRALAQRNWVDFDDLIGLTADALASDPALAARYHERFHFVCVDEFQDVDEQQYRLLRLIAPDDLCVIGDPNQAIYGFRGADASCFDRFRADYPDATVVNLTRNYRSSGTIVSASSQVIGGAPDQALTAMVRDMHERITIHAAPTERAEAEFVVASIERLIGGHSFFSIDSGRARGNPRATLGFADFAVLYRTGAQAGALVEAFQRSGIPFKKSSHEALSEQPVVRALLAELKDSDQPISDQLMAAATRVEENAEALATALQRLMTLSESCAQDRARFRDAVVLAAETDFFDPRADRVSLLTLHAAKGLEFPVVFIVGLEDGILPLKFGGGDDDTIAEERRLFYVGMTRAKDQLILSRTRTRVWRGRVRELAASPFLADIEQELVKHQAPTARRKPEDRQLTLF